MFSTWGDIAYRFRRVIPLVIIAAIVALFAIFGTQLGDRMSQEGWDDPHSQSTRAAAVEEEVFGRDDSGDVILLVRSEQPGGAVTDKVKRSVTEQLDAVQQKHAENLGPITSFFDNGPRQLANEDGTAAFASIAMAGTGEDVLTNFRAVEDDLRNISVDGVSVEVAGATAVSDALDEGMSKDIKLSLIHI